MTVGVVTTSYPRFRGDVAGNFVSEHVRWLRDNGHNVEVLAAGPTREHLAGVQRVNAQGGLFYTGGAAEVLLPPQLGTWFHAGVFTARLLWQLRRLVSGWDRVISHWLVPSSVAVAAVAPRIPHTAIAHAGDVHLLCRTGTATLCAHTLLRSATRVVFVAQHLRERFLSALSPTLRRQLWPRTSVCAMGVHVEQFRRAYRGPCHISDGPTVLYLGRLEPVKGVDVLVRASEFVDAQVVVAGAGSARVPLEALAKRVAPGKVQFTGAVSTAHRARLLAAADVVVVPARPMGGDRVEGMPLVAVEAMAAGVPVVAGAAGGLTALSEAVWLVPPNDPRALADGIHRVLRGPGLREQLASCGIRFARTLDWSLVGPRLLPRNTLRSGA